jgi:hypothetical protein
MKKTVLSLLLGLAALHSAQAQPVYVMRIPQPGMVQSPLSVSSVSPASGPYGAATQFTITGENFDETLVVDVGDVIATCGVPTKTTIACTSPLQPADGTYPVKVRRQDGGQDASKSFTYTPTGPTGVLVKLLNTQASGLALNAAGELLYLNGGYVNKMSQAGASLGTVFAGSGAGSYSTPDGCVSGYTPSLYSIAVDGNGALYLGGTCSNSGGNSSAAIWKQFNGTYATAHTSAWGGSGNNNWVSGLTGAGGALFTRFANTWGTGSYHAQVSTANGGAKSNLPNNAAWASTVAYAGAPFVVNGSGQLAKYVSGSSWTVVGPALAGNPSGSYLAASADGFLYYLPSNGTVLYKLNPATGATAKSWPLSGLSGTLSGLVVNSAGKPFIATSGGIWRMD